MQTLTIVERVPHWENNILQRIKKKKNEFDIKQTIFISVMIIENQCQSFLIGKSGVVKVGHTKNLDFI